MDIDQILMFAGALAVGPLKQRQEGTGPNFLPTLGAAQAGAHATHVLQSLHCVVAGLHVLGDIN